MELTDQIKSKHQRALRAVVNPLLIRREINNRSLYKFMQWFWSEVSTDSFKPNWHIELLCSELEQIAYRVAANQPKLHDLIINIPPGTTKTITCSIMFPVWCWTRWHWMRFITASYSAALSLESAEYSRDLIRSTKFRALYPELDIKDDKDVKSNFKVVKKEVVKVGFQPRMHYGGNRFSTSVGGTLTGFHGHILIVDDALDPNRAASEVELKKANRWVEQTLSTRKTDKAVTPTVLIMQRLHEDDPSGHILAKHKKNVRHISLPGEIRNYKKYLNPPELAQYYKDDLLDPQRMPWRVLEDMEADLGQYGYAGQVGQNPTPPGGGMFKVDHFQIVDSLTSMTNVEKIVRYWDKAGTKDAGAFTAGVKMGRQEDRGKVKWVVFDVKRGQWGTDEREDIIRETAEADGENVYVGVEREPGSGGKESAESTIMNLEGFAAYEDIPIGDKPYRADPYSVQVNKGNVILVRGDWNHAFIEEHRYFPFGTYKDQVDAAAGAFKALKTVRRAGLITSKT